MSRLDPRAGDGPEPGASPVRERLDQLLADRATEGLAEPEWSELAGLLDAHPGEDSESWERAAAWVDTAFVEAREMRTGALAPLPAHLRERIAARGRIAVRSARTAPPPRRGAGRGRAPGAGSPGVAEGDASARSAFRGFGYVAAAAAGILLALLITLDRPAAPSPERDFERLVARATDLERAAFAAVPGGGLEGIAGEVVWSDARQQGFLRLAGVPANDAGERQYQLWIVDPDRGHPQPVDGGVFDIVPRPGVQTIPIDAALPVDDPTLFVITLEPKGGVVVSEGPFRALAELKR